MRRLSPPWITPSMERKLTHKHNIYRKYIRLGSQFLLNRFRQLRLAIKKEMTAAYKTYLEPLKLGIRVDSKAF